MINKIFALLVLSHFCLYCLAMDKAPVFVEVMRIDNASASSSFSWSHKAIIDVDSKERIYVADMLSQEILVYDPKGAFLHQIAQKGPGPAEFQSIKYFTLLDNDYLVAFDSNNSVQGRLKWFDPSWRYEKMKATKGYSQLLSSIKVSRDGQRVGALWSSINPDTGGTTVRQAVLNADMEPLMIFSEEEKKSLVHDEAPGANRWVKILSKSVNARLRGTWLLAFGVGGQVYTAKSDRYKITLWDKEMVRPVAIYKRDVKPKMVKPEYLEMIVREKADSLTRALPQSLSYHINEQTIRKALNGLDQNLIQLPLLGLLSMPDGKILAIRSVDHETRISKADVFSKEGVFIGTVSLPDYGFMGPDRQIRMVFRNNRAYTLSTDEEENQSLVQYRYE